MQGNIIGLLGVKFTSENRGVNALGVSAVSLLARSYPESTIRTIILGSANNRQIYSVYCDGAAHQVEVVVYNKYQYLFNLLMFIAAQLIGRRSIPLAMNDLLELDLLYAANEGDSFSDIYGLKRLLGQLALFLPLFWRDKRLVFLPQTIGPFQSRLGRYIASYILKRVSKIYVRDRQSSAWLQSLGVEFIETIDMACYLPPRPVAYEIAEHTVGLNVNGLLYFSSYGHCAHNSDGYKGLLIEIIERFVRLGVPVLLVPHTYSLQHKIDEDDLKAIQDLKERVSDCACSYLNREYDVQEIKYIVSHCSFFMGSRLHACIGALSSSVPTVGLSYSYKFAGTFACFDMQAATIDVSSVQSGDYEGVLDQIFALYNRRDELKLVLQNINHGLEPLRLSEEVIEK